MSSVESLQATVADLETEIVRLQMGKGGIDRVAVALEHIAEEMKRANDRLEQLDKRPLPDIGGIVKGFLEGKGHPKVKE